MKSQLFIPDKIKVGYQKRSDTYTKKLAYIIYYDKKGVLRKEKSWQSWRSKDIEPEEFDNKPFSGFVLNKDVKRSSEWFGSGRNMIRVYDERGIEFEITCANLMFILMTTNCNKRGLDGEFVYAWYGQDLVLLPVGCEEYKNSTSFTELQGKSVHAKDLIVGATYESKHQGKYIYLGKMDFYTFDRVSRTAAQKRAGTHASQDERPMRRTAKKRFIFQDADDGEVRALAKLEGLSTVVDETPVFDLAERVDKLKNDPRFNNVTDIKVLNASAPDWEKIKSNESWSSWKTTTIWVEDERGFQQINVGTERKYDYTNRVYNFDHYTANKETHFVFEDGKLEILPNTDKYYYRKKVSKEFVEQTPTVKPLLLLESGRETTFDKVCNATSYNSFRKYW